MRDLEAVADLLELAFAEELDAAGRQMIREARALSRTGPLLFLLSNLSSTSVGWCPAYVWEEDGKIIGNITLLRPTRHSNEWQIVNVAVHPDYRRRGIATELVKLAIEHTRRSGCVSISLQVREQSPAAHLYQRFGFQSLGAVTRWRLNRRSNLDRISTANHAIRRARRGDWLSIWKLFSSAPQAAWGWPYPLKREDFEPSIWRDLKNLFTGLSVRRWVVPSKSATGGLAGYVEVQTRIRMETRLTLRVQPTASGHLAGDLLLAALCQHSGRGYLPLTTDNPAGDTHVEERLREAGFHRVRTLLLMRM